MGGILGYSFTFFGTTVTVSALLGQATLGLINGSFYACLSLGLAVIFGMLNIINFAHGALFMMGAFVSWMLLNYLGIGYFPSLILAPLIVGAFGVVLEKTIISRLYKLDHLYGLLLTFGLALVIEGLFRNGYGSSGLPYRIPEVLTGATNLGTCTCRTIAAGSSCAPPSSASPPGRSSKRPRLAQRCARRPRMRRWCRRSASTCRD